MCVQVFNSESGGALRPFSVSILPEEGRLHYISSTLIFFKFLCILACLDHLHYYSNLHCTCCMIIVLLKHE